MKNKKPAKPSNSTNKSQSPPVTKPAVESAPEKGTAVNMLGGHDTGDPKFGQIPRNLLGCQLVCPVCREIIVVADRCKCCAELLFGVDKPCSHVLFVAGFQGNRVEVSFLDERLKPALELCGESIPGPFELARRLALNGERTYLLSVDGPVHDADGADPLTLTACIELPPETDVKPPPELLEKLKVYGGDQISPQPINPTEAQRVLDAGQVFNTSQIRLQKGEPSRCHLNAGRLWAKNEQLDLVTGYALHHDGMWRQHSWLWNRVTGELVETTVQADKYFGVRLSEAQALCFAFSNDPEFSERSTWSP